MLGAGPLQGDNICLATYHDLLHARHLKAYREGEVGWATVHLPCRRSLVQERQEQCLALAAQCFPPEQVGWGARELKVMVGMGLLDKAGQKVCWSCTLLGGLGPKTCGLGIEIVRSFEELSAAGGTWTHTIHHHPWLQGRAAKLLHEYFATQICKAHTCDGKRRRALLRALAEVWPMLPLPFKFLHSCKARELHWCSGECMDACERHDVSVC